MSPTQFALYISVCVSSAAAFSHELQADRRDGVPADGGKLATVSSLASCLG
jgi:hypothetical protein